MLRANYQDGRSTRVRDVSLSLTKDELAVVGDDVDIRIPIAKIVVDERLGGAPRRLRFPGGAFCEVRDLDGLDALLSAMGHREGGVDRLQRHLPSVVASIAAFIALMAVAYLWLLPWAAGVGARHIPATVDAAITTQTLKAFDGTLFTPSELTEERQQALVAAFQRLQLPDGNFPRGKLLFRKSPQLRANALTLPDGTIILLDELVAIMSSDEEILAVLGHELGHAAGRHSLQILLRSSVVAAFLAFYVGDISNLLAAAPAAIAQAQYSQDFERAADDYGAQVLQRNGLPAGKLADALENLEKARPEASGGGYLSTHPATDERMRRLRAK